MEAYQAFASVYDRMMEEIPYEMWCDYVTGLLKEHGVSDGLLLELGCGTGTLTELFAERGFDMIGVDASEEMLACAMEKQAWRAGDPDDTLEELEWIEEDPDGELEEPEWIEENLDGVRAESGETETDAGQDPKKILYLLQDMREFELYGTVAAAVSLCDTMNYLTEYDDLVQVLKLVNNYLDPGGVFIFDLKTAHYFANEVGDRVFAEADEDVSYIWQNYYDEEASINQYELTLFLQEEDGRYSRCDEIHEQRAYRLEEVRAAIREAGMEFVAAYDGCSRKPADEKTNRMYFVAREKGKKQ
ncbi:MAG: methyltransferase domain-containing protein [Lachnospiraceae bacterium]|nr:methyltransferase domain-containing protein [Lachnospiraceae bacterium]